MKKLDLEKKRLENRQKKSNKIQTIDFYSPDQTEVMETTKDGLDQLYTLVDAKDSFDYQKLYDSLSKLGQKMDLTPLLSSLEKLVEKSDTSLSTHKTLEKTNIESFSKLIEVIKENKPIVNIKSNDVVSEYRPSDVEIGDTNSFYGFLHPTGKWYILRQTGATSSIFRYAVGIKNYSEAWSTKDVLDYNLYSEIRL